MHWTMWWGCGPVWPMVLITQCEFETRPLLPSWMKTPLASKQRRPLHDISPCLMSNRPSRSSREPLWDAYRISSAWFLPKTRTSSSILTVPFVPLRISEILLWKRSGGKVISNGNLLKQYLQKGVIKVVNLADLGSNGICQNPEFASSFQKTLAPVNWARTCPTAGRGCNSLLCSDLNILGLHRFELVHSFSIQGPCQCTNPSVPVLEVSLPCFLFASIPPSQV